jgi:hypothetical protein
MFCSMALSSCCDAASCIDKRTTDNEPMALDISQAAAAAAGELDHKNTFPN